MYTWIGHHPLIAIYLILIVYLAGRSADARHRANVDLLLAHRLRPWPNINSTFVQRLVFVWAVTSPDNLSRLLHHPQYFPSVSNYYWPVSGRWTDHHTHPPVHLWVTLQRQSAVTAYLKSKQLLLFAFAWWYGSPSTSCTRLSKELMVFHTHADRFKTKINTANKTGPSLVPCGTPACQTGFSYRRGCVNKLSVPATALPDLICHRFVKAWLGTVHAPPTLPLVENEHNG